MAVAVLDEESVYDETQQALGRVYLILPARLADRVTCTLGYAEQPEISMPLPVLVALLDAAER